MQTAFEQIIAAIIHRTGDRIALAKGKNGERWDRFVAQSIRKGIADLIDSSLDKIKMHNEKQRKPCSTTRLHRNKALHQWSMRIDCVSIYPPTFQPVDVTQRDRSSSLPAR